MQSQSPRFESRPAGGARPAWRTLVVPALGALILLFGLTSCVTRRIRRERFLKRVPPPQALLEASTTFADGALAMQAWLGPSVRLREGSRHPSEHGGRFGGERHGRREGREFGERGEGGEGGEYEAPFRRGSGSAGHYSEDEINQMYGRENYQYVLPPRLALTFTFVNHSNLPITFGVTDANSTLGDFAPQPVSLTIAPGKEGAVDPMLSTIQDNFDELDVSVSVRVRGRTETKVLKLVKRTGRPVNVSGP